MSAWEEVPTEVPQAPIQGLTLLSIFMNDLEDEIECILRKFAGDATMGGVADTEDRARIQIDLEKTEK